MKNQLLTFFVIFLSCCYCEVKAHDGEWFKVSCAVGKSDEIVVKLDKESVRIANIIAERGNIDNFRSHIKTLFKNILQLNHTCIFGSVSEYDYIKATEMLIAGLDDFKVKADTMEASGSFYLYMRTTRDAQNNPKFTFG